MRAPTPSEALLMIAASPDRQTMLQVLTDQARVIIGAHQSVTSLTADDRWSQAITAVSLSDKYVAWRTYDERPDGSGIYRLVCQLNEPIRMTQEQLEQHRAWRGFGTSADKHPPMRGWLAVPLIAGDGKNLGLIQLSDKYEGEFTVDDEAILVQLARLASIAIEKANVEAALHAALDDAHRKEAQLHILAQELVAARESERKRLALDLHDNIGQELVGVSIMVGAVQRRLSADGVGTLPELVHVEHYLGAVVEHLRQLAGDLQPMQLRDLGLEAGLRSLAAGMAAPGVDVRVVFSGSVPHLEDATEVAVYRVAQEALINAVRHAAAHAITLTLDVADDELYLEVRDDGRGFDPARRAPRAVGIASMEERALALGGRLEVSSAPGGGTVVRFTCAATES
jgi:signal transduction histidine kinase